MGRHLRTAAPHGLDRPVIMDATVEQLGGYRFVYVLPLGASELFVEDTYYQDSPLLDRAVLSARLDRYCSAHGWDGEPLGSETGVLPVVTGGDFTALQQAQRVEGVAVAGARGGFGHPLTSYTLPFAVETALALAAEAELPGAGMAAMLEARAQRHWRATRF
jgi:lycopene beta-cyclase